MNNNPDAGPNKTMGKLSLILWLLIVGAYAYVIKTETEIDEKADYILIGFLAFLGGTSAFALVVQAIKLFVSGTKQLVQDNTQGMNRKTRKDLMTGFGIALFAFVAIHAVYAVIYWANRQ